MFYFSNVRFDFDLILNERSFQHTCNKSINMLPVQIYELKCSSIDTLDDNTFMQLNKYGRESFIKAI